MTDSNATDELRKLLDERGVKYETADSWWTSWDTDGALSIGAVVYCEDLGSGLEIRWHTITPEQAVAATLGRGECEPDEEGNCSNCGADLVFTNIGVGSEGGAYELDPPIFHNYCPNCGRQVKR